MLKFLQFTSYLLFFENIRGINLSLNSKYKRP